MSPAAPVLLSLDTATDRIHAALTAGDAPPIVRDLPGGAQASATLLPGLALMLQEAGCTWADVDAIAFGSGPGAFTGLRTACAVAQGLALGLEIPVITLDTLMAIAEDARQSAPQAFSSGDTLWILQDARMDELYVAAFHWDGARWHPAEPARLWPLTEPAQRWCADGTLDPSLRWAGNAGMACAQAVASILAAQQPGSRAFEVASMGIARNPASGTDTVPAAPAHAAPRGAALATLARAAWDRGDTLDAALALPRYVRDKVAQTTAERAADKFRA